MNCPKCGTAVPDGAAFCPGCAAPVGPAGAGKSPEEITREWIREILNRAGYETKLSEQDANSVSGKYPGPKPNVVVTIRRNLGLITVQSWFGMKKAGWGADKAVLTGLNEANSRSWLSTYSLDKDGDLAISAYIYLAHRLTEHDVTDFLERMSVSVMDVLQATSLRNFLT